MGKEPTPVAVLVAWERAGLLGRLAPCFPIAFNVSYLDAPIPCHDTRYWELTHPDGAN